MENGFALTVQAVCPKNKTEQTFDIDIDLSNTYEKSIDCPHCGEEIFLQIKTKGVVTEETKKIAAELKKTARDSLIMLLSSAGVIIIAVLLKALIGGDLIESIGNAVIFIASLFFIAGLIYSAVYAKYLGSEEKTLLKYEKRNPYMVSIIDSRHYFKDAINGKSVKHKFLTWDENGNKQRL